MIAATNLSDAIDRRCRLSRNIQTGPALDKRRKAMRMTKLVLPIALLMLAASASAQVSRAPVRMLTGFPPGGNVDMLARLFAEPLSNSVGRPVVVDSRPGAVGQIAAEILKAAAPDGNTLLLTTHASVVIRPLTLKRPPFDLLTDFAPVAPTASDRRP